NVQEMKPIKIGDIGQTVERPTIRRRNEDIVVTCVCYVGTKATESRHRNATGWISSITDVAFETGFIERSAGYLTFANQRNSGIRSPECGRRKGKHSHNCTQDTAHAYSSIRVKLVRYNSSNLTSACELLMKTL